MSFSDEGRLDLDALALLLEAGQAAVAPVPVADAQRLGRRREPVAGGPHADEAGGRRVALADVRLVGDAALAEVGLGAVGAGGLAIEFVLEATHEDLAHRLGRRHGDGRVAARADVADEAGAGGGRWGRHDEEGLGYAAVVVGLLSALVRLSPVGLLGGGVEPDAGLFELALVAGRKGRLADVGDALAIAVEIQHPAASVGSASERERAEIGIHALGEVRQVDGRAGVCAPGVVGVQRSGGGQLEAIDAPLLLREHRRLLMGELPPLVAFLDVENVLDRHDPSIYLHTFVAISLLPIQIPADIPGVIDVIREEVVGAARTKAEPLLLLLLGFAFGEYLAQAEEVSRPPTGLPAQDPGLGPMLTSSVLVRLYLTVAHSGRAGTCIYRNRGKGNCK